MYQMLKARTVALGEGTEVRRLLPNLGRRMVGAWCFIDHYGPDDIGATPGMRVPPHPHIGLQTVSWLLEGEVLHRDSLGSRQTLRSGQLGLMTAGRGIAHSEESPADHPPVLHGIQLWVALPRDARETEPRFDFHGALPVIDGPGWQATVLLGEFGGRVSPGAIFSPLVGVDLAVAAGAGDRIALDPDFEYAVMVAAGEAEVNGVRLSPGSLLYLGAARDGRDAPDGSDAGDGGDGGDRGALDVRAGVASRLLLLGGEPFDEDIVMWWNFVARSGEEIAAARAAWMDGSRFATVHGYSGERVAAPVLPPGTLKPRGRGGA